MSLRTAMLGVIDQVTNVLLPSALDQCPSQLTIVTRVWDGGRVKSGTSTDTATTVLPQKYFMRQLSTREISGSGGRYESGDLIVEGIVPNDVANPGVGYTEAELEPRVTANGTEILYIVTGQHAGEYALVELRSSDAYEYKLVIGRKRTKPQVTSP